MTSSRQNERSRAPLQDARLLLQGAGLRPTRQRAALAALLFDGRPKHVTAEQVHADLRRNRTRVSLATVYNALHQFTDAGLLHEVVIDPGRIYFDTHTEAHHHFFDSVTGQLHDIPAADVRIAHMPKLPKGRKLDRVDIVIRVCEKLPKKTT